LPYPKARVINHASRAGERGGDGGLSADREPNIGGSGRHQAIFFAGRLQAAVNEGSLHFGIDNTALVQECFTARDGIITRVEFCGSICTRFNSHYGETLICARRIFARTPRARSDADCLSGRRAETGMTVEVYEAPRQVIADVERIMQNAASKWAASKYVFDEHSGRRCLRHQCALEFCGDPERMLDSIRTCAWRIF